MKRAPIMLLAAVSLAMPTLSQGIPVQAGQTSAVHVGPPGAEVLFSNDSFSAIRIRLAPHEKTPMHDLSARLVIWLTDGRLKDTLATGETKTYEARVGDALWVPAQRHAGENLGDKPIEWIAIVPMGGAAPR